MTFVPEAQSLRKIVSGGQTGVDRGALDAALELGLEVGGWCPKGRRAEDGRIPDKYAFLKEAESPDYSVRTQKNIADSDATLILHLGDMGPGSRLTYTVAHAMTKPVAVFDIREYANVAAVRRFLAQHQPVVLNVAGPRGGKTGELQERSGAFLCTVLMTLP